MVQHRLTMALVAWALLPLGAAVAAVVTSVETDIAPEGTNMYTPAFPAGGPSSTDLLHNVLPSAQSGNFTLENSRGVAALTDGSVETAYGNQTATSPHFAYATAGADNFVTYSLAGIYNISKIVIYGGWNDAGRDQQAYELLTSTNAGVNFTPLTSIDVNPGVQGVDVTPVSNRVEFTEDAAPNLATNVTHIRVNFLGVENGYTGYTEIDVFGTPVFKAGDANRNGIVDINDFILISNNFGKTPSAPGLDGDVVVDNIVDVKDFRLWKNAPKPVERANVPVPEPTSAVLLGVGLWAAAHARRNRR